MSDNLPGDNAIYQLARSVEKCARTPEELLLVRRLRKLALNPERHETLAVLAANCLTRRDA